MDGAPRVVLVTAPSQDVAEVLAKDLVERRLAACVNILPGVTSVYHWQGEVHRDNESLLVAKTSAEALPQLMKRIAELHPYDVPEIVALDTSAVHPPYADWIVANTTDAKTR